MTKQFFIIYNKLFISFRFGWFGCVYLYRFSPWRRRNGWYLMYALATAAHTLRHTILHTHTYTVELIFKSIQFFIFILFSLVFSCVVLSCLVFFAYKFIRLNLVTRLAFTLYIRISSRYLTLHSTHITHTHEIIYHSLCVNNIQRVCQRVHISRCVHFFFIVFFFRQEMHFRRSWLLLFDFNLFVFPMRRRETERTNERTNEKSTIKFNPPKWIKIKRLWWCASRSALLWSAVCVRLFECIRLCPVLTMMNWFN